MEVRLDLSGRSVAVGNVLHKIWDDVVRCSMSLTELGPSFITPCTSPLYCVMH